MVNNININSKNTSRAAVLATRSVSLSVAVLFLLSGCGSGFRAISHQQLETETTTATGTYGFRARKPEPIDEITPKTKAEDAGSESPRATLTPLTMIPAAANDNEPLAFKFLQLSPKLKEKILNLYSHVDPNQKIDTSLLKRALLFYYVNRNNFMNNDVITVIDYSIPSNQKRLYLVNLLTGHVWSTYVAHGSGSDRDHDGLPEIFTNKPNSNATSLGPFITMNTYRGENGLSLKLKGLAKSNSNALLRNVVIHGAWYVKDSSVKQGRSQGCPAVATKYTKRLIEAIKGGSLVYAGASQPSLHRQL